MNQNDIGTMLKEYRYKAGYSLNDVAKIICVNKATLCRWENNESTPDILTFIKFFKIYKIDLNKVFDTDEANLVATESTSSNEEQCFENRKTRLRQAREEANLSLTDAARKTGVSHTTILRLEKGDIKSIEYSLLKKLASLYHVNDEWLFGYDSEKDEGVKLVQGIELLKKVPQRDLDKVIQILRVFSKEDLNKNGTHNRTNSGKSH